jgi:hypothetical protein
MLNTAQYRLTLVATLITFGAAASPAFSQLLLYEPFDYPVGTGLGGDQPGGTSTEPVGYTNAVSGTVWSAHQVGTAYNLANDALLTAGSLAYNNLATGGNSVNHGSGVAGAASKYATAINLPATINEPDDGTPLSVYMSFLVRFNSFLQDNGVGPGGVRFPFAEFNQGIVSPDGQSLIQEAQNSTTTRVPGSVLMRAEINGIDPANNIQFGAGKSNGDGISADGSATWQFVGEPAATAGSTRQGVEFQPWPNQTFFIVMKYTFNDPAFEIPELGGTKHGQDDSVSIYLNPPVSSLGTNPGEAVAATSSQYSATGGVGTLTFDSFAISSFVLLGHRQSGSVANVSAAYQFDELRIGMSWADVTPVAAGIPGDYNNNGKVDAADYVLWRDGGPLANEVDTPGTVNAADYTEWRARFGNPGAGSSLGTPEIPEPAGVVLVCTAILACFRFALRRRG